MTWDAERHILCSFEILVTVPEKERRTIMTKRTNTTKCRNLKKRSQIVLMDISS